MGVDVGEGAGVVARFLFGAAEEIQGEGVVWIDRLDAAQDLSGFVGGDPATHAKDDLGAQA